MAHVTRAGFETCLAFGAAALAVAEAAGLVSGQLPEGSTRELLDELEIATTSSGSCSTSARTLTSTPWV